MRTRNLFEQYSRSSRTLHSIRVEGFVQSLNGDAALGTGNWWIEACRPVRHATVSPAYIEHVTAHDR